jgi:uncharacterized protein (DUF2062 family)
MWNFLVALGAGSAIGKTKTAQRLWKPVVILFFVGVLIAGLIYAFVVFHAVEERSQPPHVHARSTH